MKALLGLLLFATAAICGWIFRDDPYRFRESGHIEGDQAALAHRDSAYSAITWVASDVGNYAQLRFFNRVEGGASLRPTWEDLQELAKQDKHLRHLVPEAPVEPAPADTMWPFKWLPRPGTLPNTRYVCLFPAAVLLNQRLMAAAEAQTGAAAGAWRAAEPNILIVGLGSGIGIGVYAHHFPQASITVVDIDQVVIDMVRDHFPLLRWLESQKTSDGRPRLRLVCRDARQYIRFGAVRDLGRPFDVVVLDAYTSGSTIPPHLMTVEFFRQCADILGEDGILIANIIGAYAKPAGGGKKHFVLGGALRSMRAAGLVHAHNFPVVMARDDFDEELTRNNMTVASKAPLEPRSPASAQSWERLRAFVTYPELKTGTSVTRTMQLLGSQSKNLSSTLAFDLLARADPLARSKLKPHVPEKGATQAITYLKTEDDNLISTAMTAVKPLAGMPGNDLRGWNAESNPKHLFVTETDWVELSREVWRHSIALAADASRHGGEALVGPLEADRQGSPPSIIDPPLFTDSRPNADIFNNGR